MGWLLFWIFIIALLCSIGIWYATKGMDDSPADKKTKRSLRIFAAIFFGGLIACLAIHAASHRNNSYYYDATVLSVTVRADHSIGIEAMTYGGHRYFRNIGCTASNTFCESLNHGSQIRVKDHWGDSGSLSVSTVVGPASNK